MYRKKIVLFALGALVLHSGRGQEVQRFSLVEAQNHAIENNAERLNALLDVQIADKKVWETTALGLPQIEMSANYQHQFSIPEISFGPYLDFNALPSGVPITREDILNAYKPSPPMKIGLADNTTINITATQLVFSGPYIVGLQASKAYKKMSENALQKADRDIRSNVAQTYYTVLLLNETVAILDSSVSNLKRTVDDTKAMAKVGFVDDVVADQLNVSLTMIENSATETKRQYQSAQNLLKFQMGMEISKEIALSDNLETLMVSVSPGTFSDIKSNLESNIDLQIVANQVELSTLQLKLEKSNFLPNLAAFATYQRYLEEPALNFQPTTMAGLSLSIPLFSSGMRRAKMQQAKLSLEKSQNTYEQVKQGLEMELANALAQYTTAWEKYSGEKENKELANKVYQNYRVKFSKGMASQQDVIQANDKHLQAVGNYMAAVVELFNAKLKVDKIIGN